MSRSSSWLIRSFAILVLATATACGETPVIPGGGNRVEPVAKPAVVKGIYLTGWTAGNPTRLSELLALADNSSLNTFVIDVKEYGEVSYASSVPLVDQIGSNRGMIADRRALLELLRAHGIYPIARIVAMRDPVLAEARPEYAIQDIGGGTWIDPETSRPWVDPYNEDVWMYNIDLAREAMEAGFAEVQWDYVRFPDVADTIRARMVFPAEGGRTWGDAIEEFVARSGSELADLGVPITADVFGRVIVSSGDSGIGQDWDRLVQVTDVILPMVYPALYGAGSFGIPDPNADPYTTVRTAMDSAVVRTGQVGGSVATIRPWLQAFTLGSPTYGRDQILAQIQAVEDAGLQEWLFWNPENVYPSGVF